MTDPPGVGGGPVELVVTVVVPGECPHRLALTQPSVREGGCQLADPLVGLPYNHLVIVLSASTETISWSG